MNLLERGVLREQLLFFLLYNFYQYKITPFYILGQLNSYYSETVKVVRKYYRLTYDKKGVLVTLQKCLLEWTKMLPLLLRQLNAVGNRGGGIATALLHQMFKPL